MPATAPADLTTAAGLPAGVTLLDFGRWILAQPPEVATALAIEGGPRMLDTIEAAVELARSSAKAGSYLYDPVGWIDEYVQFPPGGGLVSYQAEVLAEMAEHGRIAVRSGNGPGKTAIGALAVLWFALTRDAAGIPWKVPTLASVKRQLEEFLWPEIHLWAGRLRWDRLGRPPLNHDELFVLRLRLAYGAAWGQTSGDPAKIEGAHADHLLYVLDEGKAIPDGIWDAAEGAFSGAGEDTAARAWALALSTPGAPAGRFYAIHVRRNFPHWRARHITKEEAIAAGRVSRQWAERMAAQWGTHSAIYQQRVEGNFATDSTNAVIPLAWVEAANERWHDLARRQADLGPVRGAGLDIAREGKDQTALALTTTDCVLPLVYPGPLLTLPLVARVRVECSRHPGRPAIVVDADGIGAGVFDVMRDHVDWAERTFPFHASGAPFPPYDSTGEVAYANSRSAAWWSLREELDPERVGHTPTLALPPDDLLLGDLTAPTYRFDAAGRLFIEKKELIRERLGRSSDSADAVITARHSLRLSAAATVTAASHRAIASPGADLRGVGDVAGPAGWNPNTVQW